MTKTLPLYLLRSDIEQTLKNMSFGCTDISITSVLIYFKDKTFIYEPNSYVINSNNIPPQQKHGTNSNKYVGFFISICFWVTFVSFSLDWKYAVIVSTYIQTFNDVFRDFSFLYRFFINDRNIAVGVGMFFGLQLRSFISINP